MVPDWFCQVEGKQYGPFTAEQLRGFAREGRLQRDGLVKRGLNQPWVAAQSVKGLFDSSLTANLSYEPTASSPVRPQSPPPIARFDQIHSIKDCISVEEKKKRAGVVVFNVFVWLVLAVLVLSTMGVLLAVYVAGWLINRIFAEYNVRKLMAYGTTATPHQFPEIAKALNDVCSRFDVADQPKLIVLNDSSVNAFAIRFAKKKVIVLLSETVEGILDKPEQLRFIIAHELAHLVLDHGFRGAFEVYKPAAYKAAREMTCDNAGLVAANSLESAKSVLKRLGVGNALHSRLNEDYLDEEARYIYSGITGWLLKQYLTYPPLGKRISNITEFSLAAR